MLDRFTVKDFKSLVDVQVDLGVVNVFIGANGSGKSNLLEAIGVLGAAASGRVDDESLMHRGVRLGTPALYRSLFVSRPAVADVRLGAANSRAEYEVSLVNPMARATPDWSYRRERLMSGTAAIVDRNPDSGTNLKIRAGLAALKSVEMLPTDPASQLIELLRSYAIYAPNTPTLRGIEPDPQSRVPVGLAGGRLADAVFDIMSPDPTDINGRGNWAQLMADILPLVEWMSGYGVIGAQSDSVTHSLMSIGLHDKYIGAELSGHESSEGALYLLFLSVLARHPDAPRLLAVDNFDHALNPRTARNFTAVYCRWLIEDGSRQVLLTTHNPLVLDGLPLQDDRVRLFAVDRSKRGHTIVNRVVVNEALIRAAEKGIPLSQQWVSGSFGGVPSGV